MGIVSLSAEEQKELLANVEKRNTSLTAIVSEITAFFENNKKAKELVYDVTSYCSEVPENERTHKAKLIASGVQKYLKIWTKAVSKSTSAGMRFYIVVDKTKEIKQPVQLVGKRKTVKAWAWTEFLAVFEHRKTAYQIILGWW